MNNQNTYKLAQLSSNIVNASTTKELYSTVVDALLKIFQAQEGQIYICSKSKPRKVFNSSKNIQPINLVKTGECRDLLENPHIDISPISTLNSANRLKLVNLASIIKVPLLFKDTLHGFVVLYTNERVREPTEEIKEKVDTIVNVIVLALTKMELEEESNKALEIRDRFISLASHELRTPLTSLHGYIQLLHAKNAEKDTVESRWIGELHVESLRMTRLVKELLDVNRIKQGQFAFVFSEVSLQEVIHKALEQYSITHSERKIVLKHTLPEDNTRIVGDFDKLVEMVSGLISNAIKFSKPSETISLHLKASSDNVSLIVKDTGKGISKKDINAVFDEFYKSDYASHIEGMGVGLLLARHIVENHRGKIKIQSKENKGTTVEVSLPIIKTTEF